MKKNPKKYIFCGIKEEMILLIYNMEKNTVLNSQQKNTYFRNVVNYVQLYLIDHNKLKNYSN